jgi:hypothetical protein
MYVENKIGCKIDAVDVVYKCYKIEKREDDTRFPINIYTKPVHALEPIVK